MTNNTVQPTMDRPATYQIKVPGAFDERWSTWDGITITVDENDARQAVTILSGSLDQAALQGLLRWIYSLGLPLISVMCVDRGG